MTEDVVHLHLEHRVVQRLLGRFSAQGFAHHDLSRACLAQSDDAIPRVVLIGRLCLYGPGAARLHEELIEVAAEWVDPADDFRDEVLARLLELNKRRAEQEALVGECGEAEAGRAKEGEQDQGRATASSCRSWSSSSTP